MSSQGQPSNPFARTIRAALRRAAEVEAAFDRAFPPEVRAGMMQRVRQVVVTVDDPDFQRALQQIHADVVELTELYDESPVAFVVDRLDPVIAARLLRADAPQRDALMIALFEQALLAPLHLDQIVEAVHQATLLQAPQRQDLLTAVRLLRDRPVPWSAVARLLLGGYEGALWLWAQDEQVIDTKRNMTKAMPGRPRFAKGVDRLLDDDGVPLSEEHRRFIRQRVFDDLANDVRHGRATVGHRECALVVLFALDGWLDDLTASRLREDASERINRLMDAHDDEPPR